MERRRGASRRMAICLLSMYALGPVGCAAEEPEPALIRPVLSTVVADVEGFRGRRFSGKAQAVNESNLASEVSGKLIERPIDVGDEVAQGQVLARLDPRDFKTALKSAKTVTMFLVPVLYATFYRVPAEVGALT